MSYNVEPAPKQAQKKKSRKEIEEECGNIPTVEFPTEVGCDALEEEGLTEFVESEDECPGVDTIGNNQSCNQFEILCMFVFIPLSLEVIVKMNNHE